jgi:iron complex outermembrane recepter protein
MNAPKHPPNEAPENAAHPMGGSMEVRRSKLKLALGAGCALAVLAAASSASAEERTFSVASTRATDAIPEFARQAGIQIVAPAEKLRGLSTPAIEGRYDTREALAMLIQGTGLHIASDDGRTVMLSSDPQSGSAAGDGAEGTVQALIVTAQKREENIQDVPIAMSAFTQEDLTRSQVAGGPDLMTQVPNFTFTKTNFSGYSIQIRGIGTQAISATTDAAVAVAFNNTPFIRNRFFEQEFYDLERVEVLRGPQGTLYGRNATAGVVNIISAKPKDHFEAKLSGDVSNYNSTRLEGMINLPLVQDKAALRIAGAWTKRDGYVKNLLTGQQTDGRDLWSARVTLGLTPTDNFKANLIWEHFSENDDRLRSGKQLCNKDPGPSEINGIPVLPSGGPLPSNLTSGYFSQGCKPASLYSPDSFQTPNGFALPYYVPLSFIGLPIALVDGTTQDPYLSAVQSRNLRAIETHITPEYQATNDTVELQLQFDLPYSLTLTSETGFNHDKIFSFEDYNRFDTKAGLFSANSGAGLTDENGVFCDPQLGCTGRLAAGDLSTAASLQFSQEFRLSSNFDGPFNFNLGANFLRYDTEDKYYVFINTLTMAAAFDSGQPPWIPGVTDNSACFKGYSATQITPVRGFAWSNPNLPYGVQAQCYYIDPNNIHNLNDEGRNYFLSKNPYHLFSYAAFGEAYYNITETLKLTAGLRWTVDRKTAPQIPSWLLAGYSYGLPTRKVIEQEWREPTARLAVDWKPQLSFTDETLVYASYVRGYKAGGANPPRPVIVTQPSFDEAGSEVHIDAALVQASLSHPETFEAEFVNAYEAGTKNTLLDGKLTLNLASFYYDYTGYQISQIVDRSAVNLNFDAKIWGAELESDWRPLENLRLGLKVGYEDTRLAKGSKAIDTMDRTAGDPNYVLQRPFPTFPSNCVVPIWLASWNGRAHTSLCPAYQAGTDPATDLPYVANPTVTAGGGPLIQPFWGTDYPGFNPIDPYTNNGEGIFKNLSGNSLPNAPHITATVTADYTLPLPSNWLMTLHTDLYYQSEAWTRVFNTPGYDKLKAYNNINVAAIFANEDAGWQVMAYVKNVLNKDNITGAFLNSDDSGLTTNVFLNEPRLYGIRVTKEWTGSEWWSGHAHKGPGAWYPYRVELDGYYGPFGNKHELLVTPTMVLFPADLPFPLKPQNDLDWGSGGGVKFTYQPSPHGWNVSAAVRYGRAVGSGTPHSNKRNNGECYANIFDCQEDPLKYAVQPNRFYSFTDQVINNSESHAIVDFMVGKDLGLGVWGGRRADSNVSVGLTYGHFKSMSSAVLHGRPDLYLPTNILTIDDSGYHVSQTHEHVFNAKLTEDREFNGAGPAITWEGSLPLFGDAERAGRIDLDTGVGAAVLFGKQKTKVQEEADGVYASGIKWPKYVGSQYQTSFSDRRTKSVSVPSLRANLGLTYTLGGVKLSGGYRVERYYKVFDAGIENRKTYDRSFDGVYAKVSIGFGG